MSHALITEALGGESYSFGLFLGQWEELQDITNCGPLELFGKLSRLEFRARWLREIIRLGLIGGGVQPSEAKKLVERYVDTVPFADSWPLAFQIVARSCYRPDEAGKKKAQETDANGQANSPLALSTEMVQ